MSEATISYIELDWQTARIATLAQRVTLALARSSLGLLAWILLGHGLRVGRQIRRSVETAEVCTVDDRARMAELAQRLGRHAGLFDAACKELSKQERLPWLERTILGRMERLCDEMEDIAETAALASSAPFARLVEQDLTESLATVRAAQGN